MIARRPAFGAAALALLVILSACVPTSSDPPSTEPASTTTVTVTETVIGAVSLPASRAPDAADDPSVYEGPPLAAYFAGSRVSGGTTYLSLDLVLFLSGPEAEDAAEAAGEEPPPNDFFILNHSTRLREYAVAEGVMVSVVIDEDGLVCSEAVCPQMSLDEWLTAMEPEESVLRMLPYWITVVDEATITSIEQQYLP